MAEQPQTMQELIDSVRQVHRLNPSRVVQTPYSKNMGAMSSTQRAPWRAAEVQALAATINLAEMPSGTSATLEAQTDMYYAEHDHEHTFRRLYGFVQFLGERSR